MKFVFELEKVLKHKRTVENVAQRDWAEAQALVDAGMKELKALYTQVEEARNLVAMREKSGSARGFELGQVDEFVNGQKVRIERQRQKVRELMGRAEELHEALVAAARERKTFEKLKEKRFEEFKAQKKKHELKQLDDLVVTRYKRAEGE